ncbi:unnamed protein product [Amoebophrya sp. A120]|nr:unnamed protein product [Amoebophrya sp. A120]|eukprot:GSA120T00013714001.1
MTTTCEKNECACANGSAAVGAECTTHSAEICKSCNAGFEIVEGNKCGEVVLTTVPAVVHPGSGTTTHDKEELENNKKPESHLLENKVEQQPTSGVEDHEAASDQNKDPTEVMLGSSGQGSDLKFGGHARGGKASPVDLTRREKVAGLKQIMRKMGKKNDEKEQLKSAPEGHEVIAARPYDVPPPGVVLPSSNEQPDETTQGACCAFVVWHVVFVVFLCFVDIYCTSNRITIIFHLPTKSKGLYSTLSRLHSNP